MSSRIDPRTFGGRLVQLTTVLGTHIVWEFPNERQREACKAAQRADANKRRRSRKLQRAARRRSRAAA